MIKCTGDKCDKKKSCMRYQADAVVQPHFEGNQTEGNGCSRYIPDPVHDPDDDIAHVVNISNQHNKKE